MSASVYGRIPSIPEYFKDFIDNSVDLITQPKICCPFHEEDTPSFSYSAEKGVWRCFGSCHTGGDVIALHQSNYRIKSRKEAERSLYELYHVDKTDMILRYDAYVDKINEDRIKSKTLYNIALQKANTVERWLELDYVMSKYPVEDMALQDLLDSWEVRKE